jgi:hypothetical protein
MESSSGGTVIKRPAGIIAGLTAAWAIFGLFLALDTELQLPPGTFFEMIGLAFGIDPSYAVYIGFLLYMITAVIIGIIYSTLSERIKALYINSIVKGVGTGILAGIIVWVVLFLPINYGIMQQTLEKMVTQSNPSTPKSETAENLIKHSNTIFWGSLALHVVFGGIMGFCARLAVAKTSIIHD